MQKKVVRVCLVDDSVKAFACDESTRASSLVRLVADKLELRPESAACFALYERKNGEERLLDRNERPCALMTAWPAPSAVDKGGGSSSSTASSSAAGVAPPGAGAAGGPAATTAAAAFVFKKRLYPRCSHPSAADSTANWLEYLQAVHTVVSSPASQPPPPVSPEDAVRLGGLQLQVVYGDHNPAVHLPGSGFLQPNVLRSFVPRHLWSTRKPIDWETALLRQHEQARGTSSEAAQAAYVRLAQQCLPLYGTTLFAGCRPYSAGSVRTLGLAKDHQLYIGVNSDGVLVLQQPTTKDRSTSNSGGSALEILASYSYTAIVGWAVSPTTFALELQSPLPPSSAAAATIKVTFETPARASVSASIGSLVQDYLTALATDLQQQQQQHHLEQQQSAALSGTTADVLLP